MDLEEFFDLNTEMNFCLREVLELEERMEEEEEDLGPDVMMEIWVRGRVVVEMARWFGNPERER